MTYSNTYYGEHTTTVNGNGVNPTEDDLIKVGMDAGMTRIRCVELMECVKNCVGDMLEEYLR